jgi:hypothetical protein
LFKRYGFTINVDKMRVMKRDTEQVVLGIQVNHRLKPGSEFRLKLAEARKNRAPDDSSLRGMEAYAKSVTD